MQSDVVHSMHAQPMIPFFGILEDVTGDPLQIGRVKVRVFNVHNPDKSKVSTDNLPWASVSQSTTSAAHNEIGTAPVGMEVGSMVWGWFLDGQQCQQPLVCGSWQGIPGGKSDLTPLATGTNTISNAGSTFEPDSPYAAQYPFNKVTTTRNGHVIEIDDTDGAERIRIYHKAGTYYETGPDGDNVQKTTGDAYVIVDGDMKVYVGGDVTVQIDGDVNLTVNGDTTADLKGDLTATVGGTTELTSGGEVTVTAPDVTING